MILDITTDGQRLASGNPVHPNTHTLGISGSKCHHSADQHPHFLLSATPTQVLTLPFLSPFQGMEPEEDAGCAACLCEQTLLIPHINHTFVFKLRLQQSSEPEQRFFYLSKVPKESQREGSYHPSKALLPEGQQLYWEDPSHLENERCSRVSFSAPSQNLVNDAHILLLLLTGQGCP